MSFPKRPKKDFTLAIGIYLVVWDWLALTRGTSLWRVARQGNLPAVLCLAAAMTWLSVMVAGTMLHLG